MTRELGKPAIAAVKELLDRDRDGLREIVRDVMQAMPIIEVFAPRGVSYVGEGELARICKIAHNVMLGVVISNLVEITLLANKMGVPRHAFLAFMNNGVMGSMFTRYKSPALVNLDWTTTFTPELLRKDIDLGLALGREWDVPMPVTAATRDPVDLADIDADLVEGLPDRTAKRQGMPDYDSAYFIVNRVSDEPAATGLPHRRGAARTEAAHPGPRRVPAGGLRAVDVRCRHRLSVGQQAGYRPSGRPDADR